MHMYASLSSSTFALGLDNELLALLLQCIGSSAGVGPWHQCGGG